MITEDSLQARNEIMRRLKFEQLKKKSLPIFIREARAKIIADRSPAPK
jgi:hypothetical protein